MFVVIVRFEVYSEGRLIGVIQTDLDLRLLSPHRHMDTSLIDVDVQPTYARVNVKGKVHCGDFKGQQEFDTHLKSPLISRVVSQTISQQHFPSSDIQIRSVWTDF